MQHMASPYGGQQPHIQSPHHSHGGGGQQQHHPTTHPNPAKTSDDYNLDFLDSIPNDNEQSGNGNSGVTGNSGSTSETNNSSAQNNPQNQQNQNSSGGGGTSGGADDDLMTLLDS
jgi:hypothetical protein